MATSVDSYRNHALICYLFASVNAASINPGKHAMQDNGLGIVVGLYRWSEGVVFRNTERRNVELNEQ